MSQKTTVVPVKLCKRSRFFQNFKIRWVSHANENWFLSMCIYVAMIQVYLWNIWPYALSVGSNENRINCLCFGFCHELSSLFHVWFSMQVSLGIPVWPIKFKYDCIVLSDFTKWAWLWFTNYNSFCSSPILMIYFTFRLKRKQKNDKRPRKGKQQLEKYNWLCIESILYFV